MRSTVPRTYKQKIVHKLCRIVPQYTAGAPVSLTGLFKRCARRLLERLLASDKTLTIVARINAQELELPSNHSLLRAIRLNPYYEAELFRLIEFMRSRSTPPLRIIDVGANVGDTFVRAPQGDVAWLCLEAHPLFFGLLERNCRQFPAVTCVQVAVSDTDGNSAAKFQENHGSASVVFLQDDLDGSSKKIWTESLDTILQRYPAFNSASVLKIDTDGFEPRIFKGAMQFLGNSRPVVYFELSPHHWREYSSSTPKDGINILRSFGYGFFLFYDQNGFLFGIDESEITTSLDVLSFYAAHCNYVYWNVIAFHSGSILKASEFAGCEEEFFRPLSI